MKHLLKKLRHIARWPRRFRTSRGFGVHSPFAFDFITKTLRDRSAQYYAYPEIDSLCGKTHRDILLDNLVFHSTDYERQEARMLFRIMVRMQPKVIVEIGGSNEVSRTIIERAVPSAMHYRWSREAPHRIDPAANALIIVNFAIDENFTIARRYLIEAMQRRNGVTIFFRNLHLPLVDKLYKEVMMVADKGMCFFDDLSAIYVADSKLPRQDFEMLL